MLPAADGRSQITTRSRRWRLLAPKPRWSPKICACACLLLAVGCQARLGATPKPEPLFSESGRHPTNLAPSAARLGATPKREPLSGWSGHEPTSASAAPSARPGASIEFVEGGADILKWDFLVRGLPAVDLRTGSIVVADLSRSLSVVSTLGLSLVWLRPGQKLRFRVWSVLDKEVATGLMYDDDPDGAQRITASARVLAEGVRERTRDANEMLGSLDLRPIIPCQVQRMPEWCAHPQRLVCSKLSAELQGDKLRWRLGTETNETILGWGVAPMKIGDGPPKDMIACIEEAHFDPERGLIVARAWDSCKERGGDACVGESTWRVISLR
jgi:hypothetical protein